MTLHRPFRFGAAWDPESRNDLIEGARKLEALGYDTMVLGEHPSFGGLAPLPALMAAAMTIATKIASNSPTAVQAVKGAVRMGQGQPIEQAVAIMMEAHWRSAVHPDRIEGIGAFNEGRDPAFQDPDF